jgi:multiple sugar transport system substrate-binding protein
MKRFILALSVVMFLLPTGILSARGSRDTGPAAAGPVNLRILWWGGQARHDRTLKVIEMFRQKQSGVQVEPEYLGWDGYWDRLAVLAAAEDMPDVFQMDNGQFPQYDRKGLLADLYRLKGFDPGMVDAGMCRIGEVSGRLLGICLGTNAYCLAYNPRLFEAAGVAAPTVSWTWTDLRAASLKIREKTGAYGLDSFGSDVDFQYWLRTRGARMYSADLKRPGWSDPRIVAEFFRQVVDFHRSGVMASAEYAVENDANEENSLYAQGKAAMMLLWSNKVVSVYKTLQADSSLMVLPGPGSREGMYLQPSMFFSVSPASKSAAEAASFITFFLGDVEANKVLLGDRGLPVVPAVRTALANSADHQNALVFDYITLVAGRSSPPDLAYPETEEEVLDLYEKVTQEVRFGRLTPDAAAQALYQQWSDLLAR